MKKETEFWVECNVCKQQLKNWTGSTPCCGSIAYLVENGKATNKMSLFASINNEAIKPTIIELGGKKVL
jgi:predicted ATP-dependent serine protease